MSKIKTAYTVVKQFKNWNTYFADHFGFVKKNRIIYSLRNGVKYKARPGTDDKGIIREIWTELLYTRNGFGLKDEQAIVDIGGQIGVFSIYAAKSAPSSKIYTFEPFPENFELLKENIQLNNATNVIPFQEAVSDKDGTATFFISADNSGGHSLIQEIAGTNSLQVKSISLDTLVKQHNITQIDFLKMDCEGGEYAILFGCSKTTLAMIKKISMEYHNVDEKNNVDVLATFLRENGFKVEVRSHDCRMLYASKDESI